MLLKTRKISRKTKTKSKPWIITCLFFFSFTYFKNVNFPIEGKMFRNIFWIQNFFFFSREIPYCLKHKFLRLSSEKWLHRKLIRRTGSRLIFFTGFGINFLKLVTSFSDLKNIDEWKHTGLITWWRHQMETFPALLALCEGNPPVIDGFPSQRPVTRPPWWHAFFCHGSHLLTHSIFFSIQIINHMSS